MKNITRRGFSSGIALLPALRFTAAHAQTSVTPAEARAKIASGVIQGGMIPKVEESLEMLEEGIEAIHIVGISPDDAVLREAEKAGSQGTAFLRG